jgi:hypothetical protein
MALQICLQVNAKNPIAKFCQVDNPGYQNLWGNCTVTMIGRLETEPDVG